jgi:hypothetical protein
MPDLVALTWESSLAEALDPQDCRFGTAGQIAQVGVYIDLSDWLRCAKEYLWPDGKSIECSQGRCTLSRCIVHQLLSASRCPCEQW